VFEAVRDVYGTELPHYFKYVSLGDESVLPKFENVQGANTDTPSLTVNVPAGTGDWFGGWDGVVESQGHLYSNDDASQGRMVDLIERREPAVMLCHWAGLYCNGLQTGYKQFQKVVLALEQRFKDETQWMKISQIGRYWTAKEFTKIVVVDREVQLKAPYACSDFTLRIESTGTIERLLLEQADTKTPIQSVASHAALVANTFCRSDKSLTVCFDLPKGASRLVMQ
jgi:hypothetical protein